MKNFQKMNSNWRKTITYLSLVVILIMSSVIYGGRFFGDAGPDIPVARAATDFKTQMVKITIPASSASTTATAPTDFESVTTASTIALIAGVTGHAMGWTDNSTQTPDEISARVELTNSSTITVTRSTAPASITTTVWVLLIEYIGVASGGNEFVVRDRRVHTWTDGNTSESYGAISTVSNTADVVVFNAGVENPNSNQGHYDRGDVRAYIDGSKNVQLSRGDGNGAIESSHQVVEFTGANWTIQTGDTTPANPATSQSVTAVSAISDVWIYHNFETDNGSIDERGHRLWLTSTTNLNVEEQTSAAATKTIRWYLIENTDMNVQTGAADAQFNDDLTNTITGFTSVASTDRSFAWLSGMGARANSSHPRDFWQFELSDASTISLQRARNDDTLDYRYQVVELPLGNFPELEQIHYHWRNDDGSETTATSATSGSEDTPIFNLPVNTTRRIRIQVSNEGNATSSATQYRLEYAEKASTCAESTGWTQVGTGGAHWDMVNTANLTDGNNTTNISVAGGGTTDENTTFETPNAAVKDTSSQTASITLSNTEFVEMEYAIRATASSSNGGVYCFRVTNSGTVIDLYSKYPQATLVLVSDFKIQRGTTIVDGTTATITAGSDYEAPAALTNAFIRITNTHMTGAGATTTGGPQDADAVTAYISNPGNLLTSITFTRGVATDETHIDWEIVEYVGAANGPNEMIVRGQGSTTYGAGSTTASTGTVSGVVTDGDMVGFITAQYTPDNARNDYNTGLSTSAWNSGTDQINFTRGEANGIAAIVSWAAVEFTGTNWKIQRISHTYTASGSTENQAITTVNSTARTFIHAQKRVGAGLQDLRDYGHEVWLSSTSQISHVLESGAATPSGHVSVSWIIENTQTDGTPMNVIRSNGTISGGSDGDTFPINIGATVASLATTSIFANNRVTGNNAGFPRAMLGAALLSKTQYRFFVSETGVQTKTYRTQIIEWPSADTSMNQADYKFFRNADSTNVGTAYANQNTPGATTTATEVFRLRLLLKVADRDLSTSGAAFKLQFAQRSGTCDTSFTGETYADVTGATIIKYANNPTPVDGDTVTVNGADPVNAGANVLQTYEEANNFSNDEGTIAIGENGLWDFALVENGVMGEISYCFRVVYSTGTLLETYTVIPEMEVSGGALTVDIVDAGGTPVGSPSVSFSSLNVDFIGQTANGTLGTASERIRVSNTTATPSWTLSIAADAGPTALWTGTSNSFDFNGSVAAGQMTIDPSVATNTPEGGCSTTGISLASSDSFDQGVTDSVTLVTAGGTADIICYWDITGIDIDQSIPDEQPADAYSIDMTVSVIAS